MAAQHAQASAAVLELTSVIAVRTAPAAAGSIVSAQLVHFAPQSVRALAWKRAPWLRLVALGCAYELVVGDLHWMSA